MKRSTLCAMALAAALASRVARAAEQGGKPDKGDKSTHAATPISDVSGIPVRDLEKAPARCNKETVSSIGEKTDLGPYKEFLTAAAKIRYPAANLPDRGSPKVPNANPLCDHWLWTLIDQDAGWKSFPAKSRADQAVSLNAAIDLYKGVDAQAQKVYKAAEDVFRAAANLGIVKAKVGDVGVFYNAQRAPAQDKVTLVTALDNQTDAQANEASARFKEPADLHQAAQYVEGLAVGGEPPVEADAAKKTPAKPAKPGKPGVLVKAYLAEVENLRKLLNDPASRLPAARQAKTAIPVESADVKAINAAVAAVFDDPGRGVATGSLAYYDRQSARFLHGYHLKVMAAYKQMNDIAAALKSSPAALKGNYDRIADEQQKKIAGSKVKEQEVKIRTDVIGQGVDPHADPTTYTPQQKSYVAGASTIRTTPGPGGGTNVTYTAPSGLQKTVSLPPNATPDQQGALTTDISTDLAGGKDKLAQMKGVKGAVTGEGGKPEKKDAATDLKGQIDLPAASGVKAGCGAGKTLDELNQEDADDLAETSGKSSAARTKAIEEYKKAKKDAIDEYNNNPKVKYILTDDTKSAEQKQAALNACADCVAAKKAMDDKIAAAKKKLQDKFKELGTAEGQAEREKKTAQANKGERVKQIRARVTGRLQDLPSEWQERSYQTTDDDGNPVVLYQGARYVTPKNRAVHLTGERIKQYFDTQWPQHGGAVYDHNLQTCSSDQRILAKKGILGSNSDVDGCIGAIFNAWMQRVANGAAAGGQVTVPTDDSDQDVTQLIEQQRKVETGGGTQTKKP